MSTHTRAWPIVAAREIQVKLTDRNFLMSTGFSVLLLLGLLLFQGLAGGGSTTYQLGVPDADAAAVASQAQELLRADDPGSAIRAVTIDGSTPEKVAQAVSDSELQAALTRAPDGTWSLVSDGSAPGQLARAVAEVIREDALSANAEGAGTSLEALNVGTELTLLDVSGDDREQAEVVLAAGLIFGMLFYLSSLMFGMSIATSVVEEKQSRIVEILAAKIPVEQLLTGKVIGNTLIALGQLLVLVGVGLVGLSVTEYDQFLPLLSSAVVWYVPFFVAGFLALACVWAAAGALCSRSEDLQSTTMPLTLVLVAIFVVALSLDGANEVIGSYVPVMSTILMPKRVLEGDVVWWEPALSLLVTLVFCAVTVRLGSTLYRRALLQTQGRITFGQALRLAD